MPLARRTENQAMQTRRQFLKTLGALAMGAAASCRRAQEYAIEPEGCPEWMLPGETACFASCMPWATGTLPLLAVCHDGIPASLQPNPHYQTVRPGLPAFAQAAILDLYNPARLETPMAYGRPLPWPGVRGAFRAWAKGLQEGRRTAFLFPEGYSPLRQSLAAELGRYAGARFYAWDPAAWARHPTFPELDAVIESCHGKAASFAHGFGGLDRLTQELPGLDALFIFTPADPAAFDPAFAEALSRSPAETIRFAALQPDATARLCRYVIPQTHFLEEWGAEADAYGGICLRQPVTLPLRPALSEAEALLALASGELREHEAAAPSPVRMRLLQLFPELDAALRRGIMPHAAPLPVEKPSAGLRAGEPSVYLHPYYADGRFAHNAWLNETFCPLSGYAGKPAAFLPGAVAAAATALLPGARLPGWVQPGLERPCLPLLPETLGVPADRISAAPGAAWPHRAAKPWPEAHRAAARTPAARHGESAGNAPGGAKQWRLIIDLAACIGCGACTLACRAENNVPLVGQEDLGRGRDIQWLRIDRYLDQKGRLRLAPMACRHCGNAPCEAVCPANATVHTAEGLNAMAYPRCWGTRYCAAACPYQARRFNFRDYARASQQATRLPANPQVTVRSRGVMEKCSYCVQRIHAAKGGGSLPQTACELACPAQAIRLTQTLPDLPIDTRFDAKGTRPATVYVWGKVP